MTGLPTGVVTFVFTDIESSTRLLHQLGSDYPALLERHDEIIRTAVREENGRIVHTEGDAFFLVFTTPLDAVKAVARFQTGLAEEPWPDGARVAVRVGIHTGAGNLGGENYWGLDVHRAARIAASGHGGQVLLSSVTTALLAKSLPASLKLRSLGAHRFKDLGEAEEVYQLTIADLADNFGPLASLAAADHNLPVQLTSFVARSELEQIQGLLEKSRLVTLTGPGGTGKTRLSLQVGAEEIGRHRDGVWFVQLAPITDMRLVTSEVAATLSLPLAGTDADHDLGELLKSKEMLLILDNFEQVIGAASSVAAWLRLAAGLKVIVTSRSPLRISGEHEFPVPALGLPDIAVMPSAAELSTFEAVALFVERARAARPGFMINDANGPTIARIVSRLDGLPLAIELAAARLRILSIEAISQRLDSRLSLLTGGARDLPERQQTLRNAIEWSYELLEPRSQELFALLSVFAGGFALEDAEPTLEVPYDLLLGLETLVDQSLLRPVIDATSTRFLMLETIRELAVEKLMARADANSIKARHVQSYLSLTERAAPHFTGELQRKWLDRIAEDHDNIRTAIATAIELGDAETAQRMCGAMWRFWQMRGFLSEGRLRTEAALAAGPGSHLSRLRALESAGGLAYWQADGASAQRSYTEQVNNARELGDKRELALALYNLSSAEAVLGSGNGLDVLAQAVELAREVDDPVLLGSVYWGLGSSHYTLIDSADGEDHLSRAIEALTLAGNYLAGTGQSFQIGWTDNMLAACLLIAQRPDEAILHLRAGFKRFLDAGDLSALPLQVASFAEFCLQMGELETGIRLAGASIAVQRRSDTRLLDIAVNEVRGFKRTLEEIGMARAEPLISEGASWTTAQIIEVVSEL